MKHEIEDLVIFGRHFEAVVEFSNVIPFGEDDQPPDPEILSIVEVNPETGFDLDPQPKRDAIEQAALDAAVWYRFDSDMEAARERADERQADR